LLKAAVKNTIAEFTKDFNETPDSDCGGSIKQIMKVSVIDL